MQLSQKWSGKKERKKKLQKKRQFGVIRWRTWTNDKLIWRLIAGGGRLIECRTRFSSPLKQSGDANAVAGVDVHICVKADADAGCGSFLGTENKSDQAGPV